MGWSTVSLLLQQVGQGTLGSWWASNPSPTLSFLRRGSPADLGTLPW